MPKLKSERHHWWPECVSDYWKDSEGLAHWILPDGETRHSPPKNFGVIGNGHYIKLSRDPHEATVWDQNFEDEFGRADSHLRGVIEWLESLDRVDRRNAKDLGSRFLRQDACDENVGLLVEGLVSLAVRSPINRKSAVGLAEKLRGSLPERERNAIMGSNMRGCQRRTVNSIGTRGKFVVMYSPDREFIFGDGFFHNIRAPAHNPWNTKILAPVTPRISVLFANPTQYTVDPRLLTLVLNAREADLMNETVQRYARSAIFYRSEPPVIIDEYRQGQHLNYSHPDNPIDNFICSIPGIPPRDRSLNSIFNDFGRR